MPPRNDRTCDPLDDPNWQICNWGSYCNRRRLYPCGTASRPAHRHSRLQDTGCRESRLDVLTIRIAATGEKTAVAARLYHHGRLALVTDLVGLHRALFFEAFGIFALGIAGAGKKTTVAAPLDDHHPLALFTLDIRLFLQRELKLFAALIGTGQMTFPRIIELLHSRNPSYRIPLRLGRIDPPYWL